MDLDNILDDSSSPEANLIINQPIRDFLEESARWGKFLSIVGFVFLGLGILGTLIGGGAFLTMGLGSYGVLGILVYLLFIGIALIPIYYLYTFSTKMQVALRDDDQADFVEAFQNHKAMFKFYGIFMAIMLGIYGIIFLIGLIGLAAS